MLEMGTVRIVQVLADSDRNASVICEGRLLQLERVRLIMLLDNLGSSDILMKKGQCVVKD